MKKFNLEKISMMVKRNLKNKVKITRSTILAFLMVGSIGVAQTGNVVIEDDNQSVVIYNNGVDDKSKYKHEAKDSVVIGNRIIAKSNNNGGTRKSDLITTSVIIGSELITDNNTAVNIGYKNKTDKISNITIGDNLESKGQYSIVIGSGSKINVRKSKDEDLKADDKYSVLKIHSISNGENNHSNVAVNGYNYDTAIVVGREANTYNQGTITLGHKTITYGERSIAIGDEAKSYDSRSIAFGQNATALGQQGYAFGYKALTYGINGLALGTGSTSAKEQAIAIGNLSISNGQNSIAIGTKANVGEANSYDKIMTKSSFKAFNNAIAIGHQSSVVEKNSTAIGYGAISTGVASVAIGNVEEDIINGTTKKTEAKGEKSIAIGSKAKTEGNMSLSIGYDVTSNKEESVTIGKSLTNKSKYSVLIGDMSENSDNTESTIVIGYKSKTDNNSSIVIGENSKSKGVYSIAFGSEANADPTDKGNDADSSHSKLGEDGQEISDGHKYSTPAIAIGRKSEALNRNTIAIGTSSKAHGNRAVAIGSGAEALKEYSLSYGYLSKAEAKGAIAFGKESKADKENAVALGQGSKTETDAKSINDAKVGEITYGGFAGNKISNGDQVSFGSAGHERQLKNIAAGEISKISTDAINGSQLYATNTVVGNIAGSLKTVLGGNSNYTKNGEKAGEISITNIGETGKDNIHEAVKAADKKVKSSDGSIKVDLNEVENTYDIKLRPELKGIVSIENDSTKINLNKDDNEIKVNGAKIIGLANLDDKSDSSAAVNKKYVDDLEIKYTANGRLSKKSVKLTEGFDFEMEKTQQQKSRLRSC